MNTLKDTGVGLDTVQKLLVYHVFPMNSMVYLYQVGQ